MNRILTSVVAVALVMSANVFAAGGGHTTACETVFGGTTNSTQTMGGFSFGQSKWNASVNAAYFHQVHEMFQVGGKLNVGFGDNGSTTNNSTMAMGILVGPTFNFMGSTAGDISDAMFIFAGAGFNMDKNNTTANGLTATDFQFGAEAGKRFKIWDNVTWRPSFSFTKVGTAKPLYAVNLVNFSVLF